MNEPAPRSSVLRSTLSTLGKPVVWGTSAVVTGVAAVISAVVYVVSQEAVDGPATKDTMREILRGDDDVRSGVDDYTLGSSYVLPTGAQVPADVQQVIQIGTRRLLRGEEKGRLLGGMQRAGAARVSDELILRVTLEARRNQAVSLTGIQAVNIKRTAPYSGPLYWEPPQAAGPPARMILDLTEQRPLARVAEPVGTGDTYVPGRLFFLENDKTLTQGKPEVFVIRTPIHKVSGAKSHQTVTFDIRIDYRIGGHAKHFLIRDHGQPFRITTLNCRPGQQYAAHSRTWQPPFHADARAGIVNRPASCER